RPHQIALANPVRLRGGTRERADLESSQIRPFLGGLTLSDQRINTHRSAELIASWCSSWCCSGWVSTSCSESTQRSCLSVRPVRPRHTDHSSDPGGRGCQPSTSSCCPCRQIRTNGTNHTAGGKQVCSTQASGSTACTPAWDKPACRCGSSCPCDTDCRTGKSPPLRPASPRR